MNHVIINQNRKEIQYEKKYFSDLGHDCCTLGKQLCQ